MKKPFLVCYDYGQGGLWAYVRAESAEQIVEKYPELKIATERWAWMTDEFLESIRQRQTYDIDEPPTGLLKWLIDKREL